MISYVKIEVKKDVRMYVELNKKSKGTRYVTTHSQLAWVRLLYTPSVAVG